MCSACFPRLSLPADASLSSTGSSEASSPASTVLSRRYDFLPPFSPRFVAFAWQYHGSIRLLSYLPPPPNAERRAWSWSPGIPIRIFFRGDDRTSQVLGEPHYPFAHVLRLRQDCLLQTNKEQQHGPRYAKSEGSRDYLLSKLNSMAFGLAVYACMLVLSSKLVA